jgi:hypothetical protein
MNAKEARALIGKRVKYLRGIDIDKTGRGYVFPRYGTIERVIGRELLIDGDYVVRSRIVEMVVCE